MYELLDNVDKNNLYKNIIETLGPNDPVFTPDRLDAAADFISSQMEQYGLQVYEHVFEIEGKEYRNTEGSISTGDNPEMLITSHYDTVPQAPGADDNLSAVSVMLESARILAESEDPMNVRFIGFTLEEGHPSRFAKSYASAQELGLVDEQFNFKTLNAQLLRKKFGEYIRHGRRGGREYRDSVKLFFNECEGLMNEAELKYFRGLGESYESLTFDSWFGNFGITGSSRWVEERAPSIEIAGVINLEMVGYFTNKPNSQSLPLELIDPGMIQTYLVNDISVGDHLIGVGDVNSGGLLDLFVSICRLEEIKLPFAWLHVPFNFEVLKQKMFDILKSDHAPFWREGIPAIMLTDGAMFRTPFYHTQADTIDKLDFGVMAKVCKALIATALNSSTLH